MERLKRKVTVDFDTARRLFTLICVLALEGMTRGIAITAASGVVRLRVKSVRSRWAAALLKQMLGGLIYVASVGVRKGELALLQPPYGRDSGSTFTRTGRSHSRSSKTGRLTSDLIITLSPEAHHKASRLPHPCADVEYWRRRIRLLWRVVASSASMLSRGSRSARAEGSGSASSLPRR